MSRRVAVGPAIVGAVTIVLATVKLVSSNDLVQVISPQRVADPYIGPLHVTMTNAEHFDPDVVAHSGAAGRVLECEGEPYSGSANQPGLSGNDSSVQALENFVSHGSLPRSGYREERRDDDRVLYTYAVANRTKVAVVVAAGMVVEDQTGWAVESYAQCDPSELPHEVTDDLGFEIWTETSGTRVPVTVVTSYPGETAENSHCGWEDVTFIEMGGHRDREILGEHYVRDPDGILGYRTGSPPRTTATRRYPTMRRIPATHEPASTCGSRRTARVRTSSPPIASNAGPTPSSS